MGKNGDTRAHRPNDNGGIARRTPVGAILYVCAVLICALLCLGACSKADSPAPSPEPAPTPAPAPAPEPEPTPAPAPPSDANEGSYDRAKVVPEDRLFNPEEFYALIELHPDAVIVDTRDRVDYYSVGFLWDSENIPANQVALRSRELLGFSGGILLVAANWEEADEVYQELVDMGCDMDKVWVLDGGVVGWLASGADLVEVEFLPLGC
ncbi:MAG: rhodanese-like domain-containing protein [Eggerthellaceae bacterium]|nr:rhodanese-like domain-containing protein [Eggerthellaceae bacterium]